MSDVFSDQWDDVPIGEDPGLPAKAPDRVAETSLQLGAAFNNLGVALGNHFREVFAAVRPTLELVAEAVEEANRKAEERRRSQEIEEVLLDIDPNNQPRRPENEWTVYPDVTTTKADLDSLVITALYYNHPIIPTNEGVIMSDDSTPEDFARKIDPGNLPLDPEVEDLKAGGPELIEGAAEAFSSPISWMPKDVGNLFINDKQAQEALKGRGVKDNRVWILPADQMPEESPIHEEVIEAYDPSTDPFDETPGQMTIDDEVAADLADEVAVDEVHERGKREGARQQREADEAEFEKRLAAVRERQENKIKELEQLKAEYGELRFDQGFNANTPKTAEGKLLFDAAKTVNGARQDQYGKAEDSFAIIADYWSTYLDSKQCFEFTYEGHGAEQREIITATLQPEDVAFMMVLFKLAREANAPKRDNRLDAAGYLALAERCLAADEPVSDVEVIEIAKVDAHFAEAFAEMNARADQFARKAKVPPSYLRNARYRGDTNE